MQWRDTRKKIQMRFLPASRNQSTFHPLLSFLFTSRYNIQVWKWFSVRVTVSSIFRKGVSIFPMASRRDAMRFFSEYLRTVGRVAIRPAARPPRPRGAVGIRFLASWAKSWIRCSGRRSEAVGRGRVWPTLRSCRDRPPKQWQPAWPFQWSTLQFLGRSFGRRLWLNKGNRV